MSRLLAPLMTGLLCASALACQARELGAKDPERLALVSLAREAPASGIPADSRLSLSLAWVNGAQAKVCSLVRDAEGELIMQNGALLLKRVIFHKQSGQWQVDHAERLSMDGSQPIDKACGQAGAETVMTAALKEMDEHPPTAGHVSSQASKTQEAVAAAHCEEPAGAHDIASSSGKAVVSLPGRSQLHTAPDQACRMGKFIVTGDQVAVLASMPGWTRVRYTHPVTGAVTVGWLQSERIKPLHGDSSQTLASQAP